MQITSMTPWATSSRSPRLEHRDNRTFLVCEAKKQDGTWRQSELDLDSCVGNNDGKFDTSGKGGRFSSSAQNICLDRDPHDGRPILRAELRNRAGEWRQTSSYPEDWILNLDGRLVFGRPLSVRRFEVVSDDRTFFICQARRGDGSWAEAKIDLDKFIGNDDGNFNLSGDGENFTQSSKDIYMKYEGAGGNIRPVLVAALRDRRGEWRVGQVELLEVIRNENGVLQFDSRKE